MCTGKNLMYNTKHVHTTSNYFIIKEQVISSYRSSLYALQEHCFYTSHWSTISVSEDMYTLLHIDLVLLCVCVTADLLSQYCNAEFT